MLFLEICTFDTIETISPVKRNGLVFFLMLLCVFGNAQNTPINKYPSVGRVEQKVKALELLVSPSTPIEVLADGFTWAEGPVWVPHLNGLLFTDVPNNKAFLWTEKNGLQLFLSPSGHTGYAVSSQKKGANGLALDPGGNLIICQVGDRRVSKLKSWDFKSPTYETIVDRYKDALFNSPNDLIFSKNGTLYFTDPPYGLKDQDQDPLKELNFNGVFSYHKNKGIQLLTAALTRPNGITLSLDEKTLFVANSDANKPVIYAFDLTENGLENQRIFFDGSALAKKDKGAFDGLKTHSSGVLFATGPGGVLVIDSNAQHLGTVRPEARTANCAFDPDENYLYMTSHKTLTRIKLN